MRTLSVALGLGLLLICGAVFWSHAEPKPTRPQTQAVMVEVAPTKETKTEKSLKALGNTESIDKVEISPEVSGQIAKILFTPGSFVQKGTPLIELNNALYKSELKAALSNCQLSQMDLQRIETLNRQSLSSNQMLDNARALLEEKKSILKAKQDALDKTTLKAPFSGVLGEKKISLGQYVTPGESLVSLNAINKIKVKYHLPEQALTKIHLGQTVLIKSSAYPDRSFKGTVTFISPVSNQTTHMIAIEAEVKNSERTLLAGLFVEVSQILDETPVSLIIPEEALIPSIEGQTVFTIKKDHAILKPVEIGEHQNGQIIITKGLSPHEEVIIRGQHKLKDGALIQVKA